MLKTILNGCGGRDSNRCTRPKIYQRNRIGSPTTEQRTERTKCLHRIAPCALHYSAQPHSPSHGACIVWRASINKRLRVHIFHSSNLNEAVEVAFMSAVRESRICELCALCECLCEWTILFFSATAQQTRHCAVGTAYSAQRQTIVKHSVVQ